MVQPNLDPQLNNNEALERLLGETLESSPPAARNRTELHAFVKLTCPASEQIMIHTCQLHTGRVINTQGLTDFLNAGVQIK